MSDTEAVTQEDASDRHRHWVRMGFISWVVYYITLMCLPLVAILLPARWQTNDDAVMGAWSNGAYDGVIHKILGFIGPVWSFLAASLQGIFPLVSVLPVLMTASVAFGCAIVLAQIRVYPARALAAAVFPVLVLWIGICPNFTTTAFILCALGATSLVLSIQLRQGVLFALAGTLLVVLGWQWRERVLLAVVLLFIIPFVYTRWSMNMRPGVGRLLLLTLPLLVIAGVRGLVEVLSTRYTAYAAWDSFLDHNSDRVGLRDYSSSIAFPGLASKFGLQPSQIEAFLSLNDLTSRSFDAAHMSALRGGAPRFIVVVDGLQVTALEFGTKLVAAPTFLWISLGIAVFLAFWFQGRNAGIWATGQVVVLLGLAAALTTYRLTQTFLNGLLIGSLLAVITILAASPTSRADLRPLSRRRLVQLAALAVVLASGMAGILRFALENKAANSSEIAAIAALQEAVDGVKVSKGVEEIRLIGGGGALGSLIQGDPYSPDSREFAFANVLSAGWTNFSPPQLAKMHDWGVWDLYAALVDSPKSLKASRTIYGYLGSEYGSALTRQVLENYLPEGQQVVRKELYMAPDGLGVYEYSIVESAETS